MNQREPKRLSKYVWTFVATAIITFCVLLFLIMAGCAPVRPDAAQSVYMDSQMSIIRDSNDRCPNDAMACRIAIEDANDFLFWMSTVDMNPDHHDSLVAQQAGSMAAVEGGWWSERQARSLTRLCEHWLNLRDEKIGD